MSTSHFELLKVYLDRKAIKTLVTKLDRNCAVNRGGNLPDLALRLFKITVSPLLTPLKHINIMSGS